MQANTPSSRLKFWSLIEPPRITRRAVVATVKDDFFAISRCRNSGFGLFQRCQSAFAFDAFAWSPACIALAQRRFDLGRLGGWLRRIDFIRRYIRDRLRPRERIWLGLWLRLWRGWRDRRAFARIIAPAAAGDFIAITSRIAALPAIHRLDLRANQRAKNDQRNNEKAKIFDLHPNGLSLLQLMSRGPGVERSLMPTIDVY